MKGYDSDFLLWSREQADLLRRMGTGERVNDHVDWEHVAEEIESLGKNDRRELASRIQTILRHLIKLEASPAKQPRAGWQRTVLEQRLQIERLFKDSSSLRQVVPASIEEEIEAARTLALLDLAEHGEDAAQNTAPLFSSDQVLGPWMPD